MSATTESKSYGFNDLIGKNFYSNVKLNVYAKTNASAKPVKIIPANSFVGKFIRYFVEVQGGNNVVTKTKLSTLWLIFKNASGKEFAVKFIPGGNQFNFNKFKEHGMKSWEEQAAEDREKYDKSPFDFSDLLNFKKHKNLYIGAGVVLVLLFYSKSN